MARRSGAGRGGTGRGVMDAALTDKNAPSGRVSPQCRVIRSVLARQSGLRRVERLSLGHRDGADGGRTNTVRKRLTIQNKVNRKLNFGVGLRPIYFYQAS